MSLVPHAAKGLATYCTKKYSAVTVNATPSNWYQIGQDSALSGSNGGFCSSSIPSPYHQMEN